MDFERAKTDEQRQVRIQEITRVAADLLDNYDYHLITLSNIAKGINFSRANLYKYIASKEEIYLILFIDEYEMFLNLLKKEIKQDFSKKTDTFAETLADIIGNQKRFLKLYSILYTIIEKNSSEEKLIEFNQKFKDCKEKYIRILKTAFPIMDKNRIIKFIELLDCFIIGFFPITSLSTVQVSAAQNANIGYYPPNLKKVLAEQIIFTLRNVTYYSRDKLSPIPYRLL